MTTAPIRLIASDLDGTLLNKQGALSERTLATLHRAMAAGLRVAFATGRIHGSAARFAAQAGINGPLITSNGGLIRELSGKTLRHCPLGPEVFEIARILTEKTGIAIEFYAGGLMYVNRLDAPWRDCRGYAVALMEEYRPGMELPEKFDLMDPDPERLRAAAELARELLGPSVTVTTSGFNNVEITAPGGDKGSAVAWLAAHYGIPMESVMVMGDNLNDLSMFQRAGLAVAVGNARTELKAAAHSVTAHHDEDGAALAIERFVLQAESSRREALA